MTARPHALATYVRAKRWKLNELTQRKQDVDAAEQACRQREQVLERALAEELARQHSLFGQGSFRVWELSNRGAAHLAILEQIQAEQARIADWQAQSRRIADEMEAERREKALLEHAIEKRTQQDLFAAANKQGRESDALVAARSVVNSPRARQTESAARGLQASPGAAPRFLENTSGSR